MAISTKSLTCLAAFVFIALFHGGVEIASAQGLKYDSELQLKSEVPSVLTAQLSLQCETDPTELIPDPQLGGYLQDSIRVTVVIRNTGDLTVYNIHATAISMSNRLISSSPSTRNVDSLSPNAPAVEISWICRVGPSQVGDSACVLVLVRGEDPDGSSMNSEECQACVWIPKAGGVTSVNFSPHPSTLLLEQNYPNPFSALTTITYGIPSSGHVRITVYDAFGRLIATLANGEASAGRHNVVFNSNSVPPGMYVYRLDAAGATRTRRMLVIK